MLVATLMEKMTGRKLVDFSTKALMGKIAGFLLSIYIFLKIIDTWAWATGVLPRLGFTFQQMYNEVYGMWLLWFEIGVFGVLPAILLIVPKFRNRPGLLYTAAIMNCLGICINRFVFTVQSLAIPVMPFDVWTSYMPNWAEYSTSLMIVAYGFIVLSLSYRYLPIFPQERKLNA